MENKRKEAQQLLVSCVFFLFASTCDQLFTNCFFFILSREHCFFLFIFLGATSVVRSSSFFFGYWCSLFFHCAFTCFLVFSYRAFCSWGAEWFVVFLLQVLIVVVGGGFHVSWAPMLLVFFLLLTSFQGWYWALDVVRLYCKCCALSMLFNHFQCCLCVVQALIMCVVGVIWALPILFCVLQVPSMLLWRYQWFSEFQVLFVVLTCFQWCLGIVRAFWHAIRCCQCF